MASYNQELFLAERISEMLRQMELLLKQVVEDVCRPLSDYTLITEESRKILPNPSEALRSEWFGSVQERFSQQAQRVGDRIAIRDERGAWSYEQVEKLSNQISHCLKESGLGLGEVVAIYGPRYGELVVAMLGVLKAGGAMLVMDWRYPAKRLAEYLEEANARGWIEVQGEKEAGEELREYLERGQMKRRLKLGEGLEKELKDYGEDAPCVRVSGGDTAYVVFTSGTTGDAKAVLAGTERFALYQMESERFGLNEGDRFSVMSGLSHDSSNERRLHRVVVGSEALCGRG